MNNKSNTLYIIIPAYNEEEMMGHILDEWYPVVEKYNECGLSRLVIVNDGSKDKTHAIVCKYSETHPLLICLDKTNSGHGASVLYGYRYAIHNNADWIFQTDSDGQTLASEFDEFWNLRKQYEAILGNRVVRGDGQIRKTVENVLRFILRIIFLVNIPDANAPYRLMKGSLVNKYINRLPDDYNLPNVMFTTYFSYYKENITFREITFKSRQGGENTINIRKIVGIGVKGISDFIRFRININKETIDG